MTNSLKLLNSHLNSKKINNHAFFNSSSLNQAKMSINKRLSNTKKMLKEKHSISFILKDNLTKV